MNSEPTAKIKINKEAFHPGLKTELEFWFLTNLLKENFQIQFANYLAKNLVS